MRTILCLGLLVALCRAEDPAVAKLVAATRDVDRGVRFAAVEALGKAGSGIDAVVVALDDPEWCVRQAAGRALSNIGASTLPALERVLNTGRPAARVEAVEAARRIGGEGAALVVAALDDEDARVRREALDGVWLLGGAKLGANPGPRLRELFAGDELDVRLGAGLALLATDPGSRDIVEQALPQFRLKASQHSREELQVRWLSEALKVPAPPPAPPSIDFADLESDDEDDRASVLARIRSQGAKLKQHERRIAELVDHEDPAIARDAVIALDLIGADATWYVLDHGPVSAIPFCKAPSKLQLPEALRMCGAGLGGVPTGNTSFLLGRVGAADSDAQELLRASLRHRETRSRAMAVWALGQMGIGVAEALGDGSAAVREIALPYVTNVARLTAILNGAHREARILAVRRLGQLEQWEPLLAASSHTDPLVRIAVAQALGERCPAVMAKDESRDVRIAAASVLRGPVLLYLLKDSNWRVRAAAVRSLGHAGIGIDELAQLLGSRNLAISTAAFESLRRIGAPAALAVARMVDNGNEASWHYAPKLFEAYGGAGSAAVSTLSNALRHPNPVARDTAARCLACIGPNAAPAAPALVEALADRRLTVVSRAAMALGSIGVTESLLGAMESKHARVRAYAAFAVGWALGAARGFDIPRFEPRLPVLDAGEPDPGVTLAQVQAFAKMSAWDRFAVARRGIWSKDPRIAYPCVAQFSHDQLNARECERVVEVTIAEGFRRGHPFDFGEVRYLLGSDELPAYLQMVNYARACTPVRKSILGNLHRSTRSEHIPAILWFERHEDAIRLDGYGELKQPFYESEGYRAERSSGDLWAEIEREGALTSPVSWWLRGEPIPPERERLLIELVDRNWSRRMDVQEDGETRYNALRALGRARSDESARYLRWVATAEGPERTLALASLAQRGEPDGIVELASAAFNDDLALSLLLEVRPELGLALVREQMSDSASAARCASDIGEMIAFNDAAYGVRWDPDRLVGIEPVIPVDVLSADALERVVRLVPGCCTKRLAAALLDRVEESGLERDDDADDWVSGWEGFLDAAQPDRFRKFLRREVDAGRGGIELLAPLGDPQDEERVNAYIGGEDAEWWTVRAWRTPKVVKAFLASDDEAVWADSQVGLELEDLDGVGYDDWAFDEEGYREALRKGEGMAKARSLLAENPRLFWILRGDDVGPRWPWMKEELQRRYSVRDYGDFERILGQLATWDGDARMEYWSILRSGRYQWLDSWEESYSFTLGYDLATLPHWAEDLESNCCRIAGRLASMFHELFGIRDLNSLSHYGIGVPGSRRVRAWFELYGGEPRWSRIAGRFLPVPE